MNLLACFGDDPIEAHRQFAELRRKLVMFFQCSLLADAEGLTHEVFLRALQSISSGKSIYAEDPASFFFGIARRVRLEEWKKRRPQEELDKEYPAKADSDGHAARIENGVYIRQLLDQVNARDRALLMASYEGRDEPDSPGEDRRLRVLLHRARKRVRKIADFGNRG